MFKLLRRLIKKFGIMIIVNIAIILAVVVFIKAASIQSGDNELYKVLLVVIIYLGGDTVTEAMALTENEGNYSKKKIALTGLCTLVALTGGVYFFENDIFSKYFYEFTLPISFAIAHKGAQPLVHWLASCDVNNGSGVAAINKDREEY